MNLTNLFPEKDWEITRMLYQGQMRSVALCKKKIKFGDQEMTCNYPCRTDRLNERNHLCTFNRITNYFGDTYETTTCDLLFFNMLVRTNISFSAAVSDEVYNFAYYLIRLGQKSVLEHLPHPNITIASPQKLFPQISRQTLSRNFARAASLIKTKILETLRNFGNVCLAIDAGKINGNPILDVTVVHAFSPSKPLLFRAFKEFNGSTEDYIEKVKNVIDALNDMSIKVTSIVGDNVPAQKQAFNHSEISMQKKYPKTIYSIPIWFSCICHTISLMLDDVFESIDFLTELNSSTKNITKIFRSKPVVSALGVVCTSFCETRWTNEYDIYTWLMKHFDIIEKTFMNPPLNIHPYLLKIPRFPVIFYNYIPRYITVLTPVRDLITFLEGDRTPACFIYPSIQECKERLNEIISADDEHLPKIAKALLLILDERLKSHYSLMMLKVLFFLTPEGREEARKTVFSKLIVVPDSYHPEPTKTRLTSDTRAAVQTLINNFNPSDAKLVQMSQVFSNIGVQPEMLNFEADDEFFELSDFDISKTDEFTGNPNEDAIYTECITKMAEDYYRSISDDQNEILSYGCRIALSFNSWIVDPIEPRTLCNWYARNPYQFWTNAHQYNNLSEFSEFVLRLLPTIASEATVERKLWRQRVITPADRFSMSEETQLNRVTITEHMNTTS